MNNIGSEISEPFEWMIMLVLKFQRLLYIQSAGSCAVAAMMTCRNCLACESNPILFERSKLRLVTSGEELQQTERDESEAEDEAEKSKVDDDMEDNMEVVDEDGVKEST